MEFIEIFKLTFCLNLYALVYENMFLFFTSLTFYKILSYISGHIANS